NSPQYLTASSIALEIRKVSGPEAPNATRAFRERKAVYLTEGAKAVQARSADRRHPSERSKDSRVGGGKSGRGPRREFPDCVQDGGRMPGRGMTGRARMLRPPFLSL